jgi:hypothetical protein
MLNTHNTLNPINRNIVPFFSTKTSAGPVARTSSQPAADSVSLSNAPQGAGNPYEGFAPASTSVKVDAWGKGKNDCLEHILKNQGYSLKEIYGKDAQGVSLLDRVTSANNMKNPNIVRAGQTLNIPSKHRQDEPESVGIQSFTHSTRTGRGWTEAELETKNGKTYSHGSVESGDHSAKTAFNSTIGDNSSYSRFRDADGNSNMRVIGTGNEISIRNQGSSKENSVDTRINISESKEDGYFENKARSFAEFFGYKREVVDNGIVDNASDVRVYRDQDGRTSVYTSTQDNVSRKILSVAGDSDDSWLEQAGEGADKAVSFVTGFFQ